MYIYITRKDIYCYKIINFFKYSIIEYNSSLWKFIAVCGAQVFRTLLSYLLTCIKEFVNCFLLVYQVRRDESCLGN